MSISDLSRHFTTYYLSATTQGEFGGKVAASASAIQGRLVRKTETIKLLNGKEYKSSSRFQTFTEIEPSDLLFTSEPAATPDPTNGQEIMMVESATSLADPSVRMYIGYL